MEDKTVFECICNIVAKRGCKILQLHVQLRSELVQMRIKMRMAPPTNVVSFTKLRHDASPPPPQKKKNVSDLRRRKLKLGDF